MKEKYTKLVLLTFLVFVSFNVSTVAVNASSLTSGQSISEENYSLKEKPNNAFSFDLNTGLSKSRILPGGSSKLTIKTDVSKDIKKKHISDIVLKIVSNNSYNPIEVYETSNVITSEDNNNEGYKILNNSKSIQPNSTYKNEQGNTVKEYVFNKDVPNLLSEDEWTYTLILPKDERAGFEVDVETTVHGGYDINSLKDSNSDTSDKVDTEDLDYKVLGLRIAAIVASLAGILAYIYYIVMFFFADDDEEEEEEDIDGLEAGQDEEI